jgi:hypothetical protein
MHVRVTDNHETRRARYEQLRAKSLTPEETQELMRYYDAIYPHYQTYDSTTRGAIDAVVDLEQNAVYRNKLSRTKLSGHDPTNGCDGQFGNLAPKLSLVGASH